MKIAKVKLRKRGQLTLPLEVRRPWRLSEGDALIIAYDKNSAIIKPQKKIKVRNASGALSPEDEDEVEYAVTDPALLPSYYEDKYGS